MENDVALRPEMTAVEIRSQVNLLQEVLAGVMKEGTHYGNIPGCDKPSLWKPGAEKVLVTFRIAADEPKIEDLSTPGCVRYRITRTGRSILTGVCVGSGVGECSSDEEKYKWRRPVCDKEYDATPEDQCRIKYTRKGDEWKQVKTNPADVANTVLKMADKRALVAMTLLATAASDIFTQDIEDLPEEIRSEMAGEASDPIDPPKVKTKKAAPKKEADTSNGFTCQPSVISVKDGGPSDKPWHKTSLKYKDEWYSTFDEEMGKAIEAAKDDHEITVIWEKDGKYRTITSVS